MLRPACCATSVKVTGNGFPEAVARGAGLRFLVAGPWAIARAATKAAPARAVLLRITTQKAYRSPNWICRAAVAEVTFPNDDDVSVAVGLLKLTWFGRLNSSLLNWSDCFSRTRNSFCIAKSQDSRPSVVTI